MCSAFLGNSVWSSCQFLAGSDLGGRRHSLALGGRRLSGERDRELNEETSKSDIQTYNGSRSDEIEVQAVQ